MSIEINTGESIVVQGKPEVVVFDAFVFVRNGVEVGKVKATYDFKGLAPDLQGLALQMIQQHRARIALPWW